MKCPKCKEDTLKRKHNCAHGMPETHIDGTERLECKCGFYARTKEEAEKHGLKFILDK